MDFSQIAGMLPAAVVVATVAVIVLVYLTDRFLIKMEKAMEKKAGKEIKIFDSKKIWMSLFWCAVLSLALVLAEFVEPKEAPFYLFVIMGFSGFFYNAFIWKFLYKKKEKETQDELLV